MEVTLWEIKPLLCDMINNEAKVEKFRFEYSGVVFEVIFLIERTPYELLFGVIDYNFSFVLKMYKGYKLESLSDEVFYKLCNILKLKPSKDKFNSFKFLMYFSKKIPQKYSKKRIQPDEIAVYKKRNIEEADKIYFCGWKLYTNSDRHARNFEKTREWLGEETYEFCKLHNISSCWTDKIEKRKNYYSPQTLRNVNG